MLERDVIQTRGFRNIEENGEVTGFQIRVRSDYFICRYEKRLQTSLASDGTGDIDCKKTGRTETGLS